MRQPLPDFPPLFPPLSWWRIFLRLRLEEVAPSEAISQANEECGLRSREWLRIALKEDTCLSLPLMGGASSLKNYPPESWRTSRETARESGKIAATIATLYGRSPFFPLLKDLVQPMAELLRREEEEPTEVKISEICNAYFQSMADVLGLNDHILLESLRKATTQQNKTIKSERQRLIEKTNFNLSVIDSVMRFGPDTIFALLPAL